MMIGEKNLLVKFASEVKETVESLEEGDVKKFKNIDELKREIGL